MCARRGSHHVCYVLYCVPIYYRFTIYYITDKNTLYPRLCPPSLFQQHQILNFENQKNLQTTYFMWKFTNDEIPKSFSGHFNIRNSKHFFRTL